MVPICKVIWEAYIGEYASGKSEVAVNRAISLLESGKVTLVDLDLVEPFYTLRPIRQKLIDKGIDVIAWETSETLGLGEAGSTIKPAMRWVLRRPGNIILDVGYGVEGAKVLNLIEGAVDNEDLKIFVVLNLGRPMTGSLNEIVDYVRDLGSIHGIINNSHLGDDTTAEFIEEGAKVITQASKVLKVPVITTYAERKFSGAFPKGKDSMGNPVQLLDRYMMDTFW